MWVLMKGLKARFLFALFIRAAMQQRRSKFCERAVEAAFDENQTQVGGGADSRRQWPLL
jgi:hypothetical protein